MKYILQKLLFNLNVFCAGFFSDPWERIEMYMIGVFAFCVAVFAILGKAPPEINNALILSTLYFLGIIIYLKIKETWFP